jgi:flagellar protein FlaG
MMDTIILSKLSGDVRDMDGVTSQAARGDPAATRFWNESPAAGSAARTRGSLPLDGQTADQSGTADAERIASALRDVKNRIRTDTTSLRLRVDGGSGSVQAEIVDAATDKVIRKIPSDELLRLAAAIKKGSPASIYDGTA